MTQQLHLLDKLKELVKPIVTTMGYELWGCTLNFAGKHTVFRVYIELVPDAAGSQSNVNVTLDDCSKVSREISAVLDVEDIIKGRYTLEVSSPGMDRQLFNIEQYQRFVGSLVAVRLLVSEQGKRNYRGRLEGVDNSAIRLQIDNDVNNVLVIPLAHIDKTNIIPEF